MAASASPDEKPPCRSSVDRHAAKVVVADDRLRPKNEIDVGEGPDRHHLAVSVTHIDAIDVVDARAFRSLALQVHLPGPSEQVESLT